MEPESQILLKKSNSNVHESQEILVKWRNVSLSVESNGRNFELLKNISGYANSRQILAVMGMSGSGKTSLLTILANNLAINSSYSLTGSVKLNDTEYSDTTPNRYIRYIPQDDELYDFLTPREHFKFFGKLQMNLSREKLKEKVSRIIKDLKLERVADSIVGNSIFKGLSGGEKKRVAIGAALISDPSVIILDEPTSGLDSFIALSVMELIKETCKYGVTVILTIHQPSVKIIALIDRIAYMQEGQFVYQGDVRDSMNYFESIGFQVPANTNPSDYFIKILNIEDRNNKTEKEIETQRIVLEKYKSSEAEILAIIDTPAGDIEDYEEKYKPSFFKITMILLSKTVISIKRNPIVIFYKLVQSVVVGLIMALLFIDLGYDSVGMDDRSGALVVVIIDCFLLNIIFYSIYIAAEKQSVLRNYNSGLFGLNSYFISILSIEALIAIPCSIFFSLIVYWIIGFNNEGSYKIVNFMILVYLESLAGMISGIMASSFVNSIALATFLGPTIAAGEGIIGTLFTHPDSLNKGFKWIKYCSVNYFIKLALWKNEFDDLDYDDDVKPEPNSRFGIEKTIPKSIMFAILVMICTYLISIVVFWYRARTKFAKFTK